MNEPIHTAAPQAETTPQTQPTGSAGAQTGPQVRRDANGRFAIGNGGGPGNPFARQTAALHKALLDKVTVEEIGAIADKLLELAKAGNLAAAKLLLQYVIGKPAQAVQPDNLDIEEWEQTRATAWKPLRELQQGMGPGLEFPLLMARTSRPGFTRDHARMFYEALHQPKQAEPPRVVDPAAAEWLAQELERLQRAKNAGKGRQEPSPNGKKSARPPLRNGFVRPVGNGQKRE